MLPMRTYVGVLLLLQVAAATTSPCPGQCECSSWLATYIACRGTTLSEIPTNNYDSNLEALYFTYNKKMTVLRNDAFVDNNFATLKVLILNNNKINTIELNSFNGLSNIKQLDLSGNELTTIPQPVFLNLKRLSRLNLSFNSKLELPEQGFFLPKLTVLILKACSLERIPPHFFKSMPNLKKIKLDRNKFANIDAFVFLPVVRKLKVLDLSLNKMTRIPTDILEMMPNTIELHLEHNRYHCDCEFRRAYCQYELRSKTPRLSCSTPIELRGRFGPDLKHLITCNNGTELAIDQLCSW